jgi:hypothetical protein
VTLFCDALKLPSLDQAPALLANERSMELKVWCVHVTEHPRIFESIEATSAVGAKQLVLGQHYDENYDNVSYVEVMRECECGTDNDSDAKKCSACGVKL